MQNVVSRTIAVKNAVTRQNALTALVATLHSVRIAQSGCWKKEFNTSGLNVTYHSLKPARSPLRRARVVLHHPTALQLLWWAQAAELHAQLLAPSMSKLTSLGPMDKKHHRLLLPLQLNQPLMLLKLIALLVQLQVTELRVVAPLEVANHPASHHLERPLHIRPQALPPHKADHPVGAISQRKNQQLIDLPSWRSLTGMQIWRWR